MKIYIESRGYYQQLIVEDDVHYFVKVVKGKNYAKEHFKGGSILSRNILKRDDVFLEEEIPKKAKKKILTSYSSTVTLSEKISTASIQHSEKSIQNSITKFKKKETVIRGRTYTVVAGQIFEVIKNDQKEVSKEDIKKGKRK